MSVNIGTCWEYGYEFPSSAQITLEGTALAISVWNAILFFFQKQTPHQSIITWTYAKKVTEEFRYALFKIFHCQQGSHYRSGIRGRLLIMNCRLQWLVDERASVPRILTAWVHCVICLAGYLLIFFLRTRLRAICLLPNVIMIGRLKKVLTTTDFHCTHNDRKCHALQHEL